MPVRTADEAKAFFAWRVLVATPADLAVLAHMVVEHGKAVEAATTGGAVELGFVVIVVPAHRKRD